LRDGNVRVLGPSQGLETDTVVQILEDQAGDLWLGTYQGVLRVARSDLEELLADRRSRLHPRRFDHADGLLSAQCNTGPSGALRARDGGLFFCTYQGLLHIQPRLVADTPAPPVVRQEDFIVAGKVWDRGGVATPAMEVAPGQQRFEFRYTALRTVAAERVRFRYRLSGLETEWNEAGSRRSAYYSYVPPGRYRFEVTAHGGDGVWNPAAATLEFVVLPHFWETLWFRIASWLGGVLVAVGIVVALLRQRHRRQVRALEHQRAVERERARIARDLHDELGSRLTKAGMVAEMAARDLAAQPGARQRVLALRATLDEVTATMDELVWAVNPKHDTLDGLANYLIRFTQEFFRDSPIRCELNVPPDLPAAPLVASLRHDLFLAYKEAVANAAKHARATVITVRAEFDGHRLTLEVCDDGVGFDPAAPRSRGRGLENMGERLQSVGGQATIVSAPGRGTCVRFAVPLAGLPHVHGNSPSTPKVLP
jgi:signal transduction histidine kinase